MIKKIIIILILTYTSSNAEEINRVKEANPKVPKEVRLLLSNYWQSAREANQDKMRRYSEATSQFKIDISIAQKLQVQNITTKPTYFEKVVYRSDSSKVSYLVSIDLYSSGNLIKESLGCHILKKRNEKFFIVGYIGDCIN